MIRAALKGKAQSNLLQRQCDCASHANDSEGQCDSCKEKSMALHRKRISDAVPEVPENVYDVLRGSGQSLDATFRMSMEQRFHHDFRNVRVHADAPAGESAEAVRASAYAVGSHIVFAPGRYNPASASGRRLIAHELAHVAQSGGAAAGGSLKVAPPHSALEAEADRWSAESETEGHEAQAEAQAKAVTAEPQAALHRDETEETTPQRLQRQAKESAKLMAEWVVNADKQGRAGIKLTISSNGSGLAPGMAVIGESGPRPSGMLPREQSGVEKELLNMFSVTVLTGPSDWTIVYTRNKNGYMEMTKWDGKPRPAPAPPPPPPPAPAKPAYQACFDGKTVSVSKNGKSKSCPAFTANDAPTPEGTFCVRKQGEAQLPSHWYKPWRPSRANWFLLEPQFSTTRFRMDLHPGSRSKGCVTVSDKDCFGEIADILNSGGTTVGYGYDGYPPGNDEGVNNSKKDVECVAMLNVTRTEGACSTP